MSTVEVWDREAVNRLLSSNDKAVTRAVLAVYRNQTESEKATKHTTESNSVGFTSVDAEILTNFAEFYQQTGFLTPKQLAIARNKMKKYWRQLLAEIERNGRPVSYKTTVKGRS